MEWIVNKDRYKYDEKFDASTPSTEKFRGSGEGCEDDQVQAAEQRAGEDMEAQRRRQGWYAGF